MKPHPPRIIRISSAAPIAAPMKMTTTDLTRHQSGARIEMPIAGAACSMTVCRPPKPNELSVSALADRRPSHRSPVD